jgi:hypothetical protein
LCRRSIDISERVPEEAVHMQETDGQTTATADQHMVGIEPTPIQSQPEKESRMQEVFEEATKNMEKMFEPWKQMMENNYGMMKGSDLVKLSKCSPWIGKIREAYDAQVNVMDSFTDQTEEFIFDVIKATPFKSEEMESGFKEIVHNLRSQNKTRQDLVRDNLNRMENLFKEWESNLASQ